MQSELGHILDKIDTLSDAICSRLDRLIETVESYDKPIVEPHGTTEVSPTIDSPKKKKKKHICFINICPVCKKETRCRCNTGDSKRIKTSENCVEHGSNK